jgi:CHASE3 domain sensor protein
MGSIERRLDNLERVSANRRADKGGSPRYLDSYFRALENFNREKVGLAALPYTEEDRQDDEELLRETLPTYRASPGWQTQEAQSVLDEWEKHTLHSLENGA